MLSDTAGSGEPTRSREFFKAESTFVKDLSGGVSAEEQRATSYLRLLRKRRAPAVCSERPADLLHGGPASGVHLNVERAVGTSCCRGRARGGCRLVPGACMEQSLCSAQGKSGGSKFCLLVAQSPNCKGSSRFSVSL